MADSDNQPDDRNSMSVLFLSIWNAADNKQWSEIEAKLSLDPATLSDLVIVATLRYSFAVRHHLSNWDQFLVAARAELTRRHDAARAERMLHGLTVSLKEWSGIIQFYDANPPKDANNAP